MPYFPKSRIQTNLYTAGGEYIVASTGEHYIGPYYKLFNGLVFTGKTPYDGVSKRLYPEYDGGKDITNVPIDQQLTFLNSESDNYNKILNKGKISLEIYPPQYIKPKPTSTNYQLGEFTRYFFKKRNELIYIETNEENYNNAIKNKKGSIYALYKPFKLNWKLTGNEKEVCRINTSIVLLKQKKDNLPKLSLFLKNSLEFYIPNNN